MSTEHIKIFTGSPILTRRLRTLLNEEGIDCLIKSDRIPAYEISNFIDELYVLDIDEAKASEITQKYKEEINA